MDWRAHVEAESRSASSGSGYVAQEGGDGRGAGGGGGAVMRDELEANRRGGGYLDKVDFLDRVGARREELFEKERSGKRRKAG